MGLSEVFVRRGLTMGKSRSWALVALCALGVAASRALKPARGAISELLFEGG